MAFLWRYSRQSSMHAIKNSNLNLVVSNKEDALTGLFFGEFLMSSNMVAKITPSHQINDEVKIFAIFKGIVHVDQEPKNSMMVGYWHQGKLTNDATDKGISFRS